MGPSASCLCRPLQVNSMKELYLLLEEEELAPQQQADNKTCAGDAWTPNTVSGVGRIGPHRASLSGGGVIPNPGGTPRPSPRGWQRAGLGRGGGSPRSPPGPRQPNECIKTLADMKVTLKELCTELREERRGAGELQQQFTKAKAAWEMERAELKCHIAQVGAAGGGDVGLGGCPRRVPKRGCWGGLGGRMARRESQ